ncbi:MAG TPA: GNAT family N-acetyltransferase [Pyrinomonadaceae bacterium]|nr:GNAT family N-acetyltransferase [Pyrinomonadaceae bacterium]
MLRLFQANTQEDIEHARSLFQEYAAGLGISLCFQNFDRELASLPGDYEPPDGRLLLATEDDQLAGCIALRKLGDGVCEMKRLFIRPAYRGKGLGRVLVAAIIDEARQLGYTHMRLDTIPGRMDQAIALYRSIGFVEIAPYYESPIEDAKYMQLELATT